MASTGKPLYRSLEIVQAIARRPERGSAIGRDFAERPPRSLLRPAAEVIEASGTIAAAWDKRPERLCCRGTAAAAAPFMCGGAARLGEDFAVPTVPTVLSVAFRGVSAGQIEGRFAPLR
jgi:hypothetical protein